MTLAQYLAMLEAGGAYQPTPAPPKAQTNINWDAVAGQPLPDPTRAYTYPPVEVVAERLPGTIEQPEMATLPFQELYGRAYEQPQPPAQSFGFARPAESPKLPPLPVKGAAPSQPMANVIDMRPPAMPSDAVPEMTPTAMGMAAPGADIAMQAQEPTAQQKLSPEEEAKRKEQERIKAWRSGQPFDVTLPDYGGRFTVTGYSVDKANQGLAQTGLKIQDPNGTQYDIPYTAETKPIYDAASSAYKTQYDQTAAATAGQEYASTITVGGKQFPAKITKDQRGLPTVIYKTESGLPAAYPNFYDLQEGETFVSPVDMPGALDQAKQERQQFLRELKQTARGVSGNIQSQLTPDQIAARLIPVPGPEPTAQQRESGQLVPGVSYNFVTDTGEMIPVEKAVELGLLQPGVKQALDQSTQERMAEISARAKARQQYQQEKPQTMAEADIERIKTQKAQAETQLKEAEEALATDPGNKDKQAKVKELKELVGNLNSSLSSTLTQGRSVKGAGGVTITEGGVSKIVESLDPTSTQGALDIYGTGAAPNKAGEIWDMRDVGREAIDNAKLNFPPTGITKDERLERGAQALNARLGEIEQVAVQKMGASAPDILDMPVQFTYISYDENQQGIVTSTTMNLRDAITSASAASRNYQQVMSNPSSTMEQRAKAKTDLQVYHQILAGRWDIQFPGDEDPTSFAAGGGLEYLRNSAQYVQATPSPSARVQGARIATPLERSIAAPPIEVTRPAADRDRKEKANAVSWFPGWNKGATQQGMPSKVKVNSSFRLSDMIDVTNGPVFQFAVDKYSPNKTNSTVSQDVGMAMGYDDGTLTAPAKKVVSDTIKSINDFMIKPEAKPARAKYATMMYHSLNAAGAGIPLSVTGFVDRLEDIYNAGDEATANDRISRFLKECGLNDPDQFRTFMGREIAKKIDATSSMFPNSKYIEDGRPVLYNQLRASIYDAALLYKNAGVWTSSITVGTPRSAHFRGVKPTITWFVDWTTGSGQAGDVQSALTVPAASYDTTMAPVMDKNQAQNDAPMNNPLDPTIPRVIALAGPEVLRAADDLNEEFLKNDIYKKLTAQSNEGWDINVGSREGNAYENSADWRKEDDTLTQFDSESKRSVAKVFTGSNVLHNLFPAYRIRGKK